MNDETAGGLCPRCLMAMNFDTRTMPEGEEAPRAATLSAEEMRERFPQFEILEYLGRGGMGVVYKARQKALDRVVAIKVLAGEWQGDADFAARFEREAKTLAQMSHPNIVTVHDFGDAGGLYYIVMEYIDGVNLRDLLREGKMAPEQALAIVPPVCEALEYAHGKGVVHRDIKPENLLLDRDGRVKIADFGIASLVGATGEKSGTPPYMAPEQESGAVDRRTDIYALGVVLYEMLTGERPAKDVVAPSRKVEVDVKIDEMVLRALEKEPERRYQTAGELRTVVETIQPASSGSGGSSTKDPPRSRGMFRRWWWVLLVLIPVGLLLGIAGGAVFYGIQPKKYEAKSVVQIRPLDPAKSDPAVATQIAAMKSGATLSDVAERLALPRRWRMHPEMVQLALRRYINVTHIRGTSLIEVRVRYSDRTDVVDIAKAFVEAYRARVGDKVSVLIHEEPMLPDRPVSPVIAWCLAAGAAAGLLVSPFIALLVMVLLQRVFPEGGRTPKAANKGKWGLGLLVTSMVAGFTLWDAVNETFLMVACALVAAAAVACGIRAWKTRLGKFTAVVSGLWLVGWLVFAVGFLSPIGSLHQYSGQNLYPRLEVPRDHGGMLVVAFGQPGYPELPIQGKHQVLRFPEDGILITSSVPRFGLNADHEIESRDPATGKHEVSRLESHWETGGTREAADGIRFGYQVWEVGGDAHWKDRKSSDPRPKVDEIESRLRARAGLAPVEAESGK